MPREVLVTFSIGTDRFRLIKAGRKWLVEKFLYISEGNDRDIWCEVKADHYEQSNAVLSVQYFLSLVELMNNYEVSNADKN